MAWSDLTGASHELAHSTFEPGESSGNISHAPDRERHFDDALRLTTYSYRITGAKQDRPRDRRCVKQRFINRYFSGGQKPLALRVAIDDALLHIPKMRFRTQLLQKGAG